MIEQLMSIFSINTLENLVIYTSWAILVFIITLVLIKIMRMALKRYIEKTSKYMKVDPTHYNFFKHFLSAVIFLTGIGVIIYIIPTFRSLAVSLLAGAGILAVVIGLASQQALSNLVGGVMIVIFKPLRVGDWVSIGTYAGTVEDITLRHTVIRNRENKRIIMPNSIISNETIENFHIDDEKICRFIEIGISYDADINKAMKIMREESEKHPFCIDNRKTQQKKDNKPIVRTEVVGFGDSSVNLRAWVWAKNFDDGFTMHLQLNKLIKERFDKEGVEIPFPYRTIVYKTDIDKTAKKK